MSDERLRGPATGTITSISAITLGTHDMASALRYGGESAAFSSFSAGNACLNLIAESPERRWSWWGRVIFHVPDVDALYRQALQHGLSPDAAPCDASWGERFFHITDPDGHELSFATPLP